MTEQETHHKTHQPTIDVTAAKIKNLWIAIWILSGSIVVLLIWLTVLTAQLPGSGRPYYHSDDPYRYSPGNYNNVYR